MVRERVSPRVAGVAARMARGALIDALVERHGAALVHKDSAFDRAHALTSLVRCLAALGRWSEADRAMTAAVEQAGWFARSPQTAMFVLDALRDDQRETAQRWAEVFVRSVTESDDNAEDNDTEELACLGSLQQWLGRSRDAEDTFARLRALPAQSWCDLTLITRAMLHAEQDEGLEQYLRGFAVEGAASELESALEIAAHDWLERLGVEEAQARFERVVAGTEAVRGARVLALAHMRRGDHAATLDHRDGLYWTEQVWLWERLSTHDRQRTQRALEERFADDNQHGRWPAMVKTLKVLVSVAPDAARPLVAGLLAPRSSRASRSVRGKTLPLEQLMTLAWAAESCGLEVSALEKQARTRDQRLTLLQGRLVAHHPGDVAWATLRDAQLANVAERLPHDPSWALGLLETLEQRGDIECAMVLAQQVEARLVVDPYPSIQQTSLLVVRWQSSEEAGRAAPRLDDVNRPYVAQILVSKGYEARALALLDSLSGAERIHTITAMLKALVEPVHRLPLL